MSEFASRHCAPCSGETPKLAPEQLRAALQALPGWRLEDGALRRRYEFKDFAGALAFTHRVGGLAEEEGHHPDLCLGWGYVEVELKTHAIGGLSENDLILAAKIGELPPA